MTHTPPPTTAEPTNGSRINYEKAQHSVSLLLEAIGEDPTRDDLAETCQRRVPEAFATLTEGTAESAKPTTWTFDAETSGHADELDAQTVLVELHANRLCKALRGIETQSTTTTRATVGEPTDTGRSRFQTANGKSEAV